MVDRTRCMVVTVLLAGGLCLAWSLGCCPTPEVPDIEEPWIPAGTVEIEEPAHTVAYLQEALEPERPLDPARPEDAPAIGIDARLNRIYYLLSAKIRDELPYRAFVRNFPALEPTLREWVERKEVQAEEPVAVANGIEGRRVFLGRPGSAEEEWIELRFVLEHDPVRFPHELIAVWRLRESALLDELPENSR